MKKTIPEEHAYFCDRCGAEVVKGDFDSDGLINFVGRDNYGHAVGGYTKRFELCYSCTKNLKLFIEQHTT